jgi:hypothetical protein
MFSVLVTLARQSCIDRRVETDLVVARNAGERFTAQPYPQIRGIATGIAGYSQGGFGQSSHGHDRLGLRFG